MLQIGVVDISRTPAIIDNISEVAKIVNKKTKKIKGYYIPVIYEKMIKKAIDEIEYQNFKKRNKSLIDTLDSNNEDTLMDGLDDEY